MRSNTFVSDSLAVSIEMSHSHLTLLIPRTVSPGYEQKSTINWTLIQTVYTILNEISPALQGVVIHLAS